MTIQALTRRVWSDRDEDFIDTMEVFGYEVRSNDGTALGFGESRELALQAAREAIVLPTRRVQSA